MMRELHKHPYHYLSLALILGISFSAFIAFWPDEYMQKLSAFTLALSYFCWGVIHHATTKTLHTKIVLEYFFVSVFAGTVLYLLVIA